MTWFILSVATSLCYILLCLSFFFPDKFIQIKNIEKLHELKWALLAVTITSIITSFAVGFYEFFGGGI